MIEASKFHQMGDHPDVFRSGESPTGYAIFTLENTKVKHEVTPGDWIITGVEGEVYPCKPCIFLATYERVDDDG